jgi:hypothetical protein
VPLFIELPRRRCSRKLVVSSSAARLLLNLPACS